MAITINGANFAEIHIGGFWQAPMMKRTDCGKSLRTETMPNLPPGFFPLDRICAYCHWYTFQDREPGDTRKGLAYCGFRKAWFWYQLGEADEKGEIHKPAGERSCGNWIQKGTV